MSEPLVERTLKFAALQTAQLLASLPKPSTETITAVCGGTLVLNREGFRNLGFRVLAESQQASCKRV